MTINLVSLSGGGNNRYDASHGKTLSHNVVSSKTHLSGIRIYNFSGDRHWLLRWLYFHPRRPQRPSRLRIILMIIVINTEVQCNPIRKVWRYNRGDRKIQQRWQEAVNQRRTDNTIIKRKQLGERRCYTTKKTKGKQLSIQ